MIRLVHREYDLQTAISVLRVLDSGWVAMGSMTEKLEKRLAEITKMTHAVATNSCTSALFIALRACVKREAKVILSPFTFASALHAIVMAGVIPVFVDIEPYSCNISSDSLTDKVLEEADAIIVSHYAGIPCCNQVIEKANNFEVTVIDDSAHALGAFRKGGMPIQSYADIACLSFNSTKIFSSGEGGAIVTNSESTTESCRLLRNYGMTKTCAQKAIEGPSFDIQDISLNLKFNDILAAVILPQFITEKMSNVLNHRAFIAQTYKENLENQEFQLIQEYPGDEPSWLFFPILLPPHLKTRKMDFVNSLRTRGVEASILFPDLVETARKLGIFHIDYGHPVASDVAERIITLPCHEAMTESDVKYVLENLVDIARRL